MVVKFVRSITIIILSLCAQLLLAQSEFENACQKGARARIEFHIIDDEGSPVSNATVNTFFDMIDRSKGKRIIGNTNTNGVFVAEATTGGEIEIEVSKKQYYPSKAAVCLINMGNEHKVIKGKW